MRSQRQKPLRAALRRAAPLAAAAAVNRQARAMLRLPLPQAKNRSTFGLAKNAEEHVAHVFSLTLFAAPPAPLALWPAAVNVLVWICDDIHFASVAMCCTVCQRVLLAPQPDSRVPWRYLSELRVAHRKTELFARCHPLDAAALPWRRHVRRNPFPPLPAANQWPPGESSNFPRLQPV